MDKCKHFDEIKSVIPTSDGCSDCMKNGDKWFHLRLCMECGYVGCCDNSKNKHAAKHFKRTNHSVIRSFEKGESWMWCFIDEETKQ